MLGLYIAVIIAVSYFLGCINGAILISKYIYKNDIRKLGSGNAGLTNFYRSFGGPMTLVVLAIDLFKSGIAVLIGGFLLGSAGYVGEGKMLAMLFSIVGHMFPFMFRFKGGKGILSTAGALLFVDWRITCILLSLFIIITLITRYVSLASVIAVAGVPVCVWFFCGHNVIMTALGAACALLAIFMHRANIVRLVKGEEPKFSFKRKE